MVSLRRRRLLGLCSGKNSVLYPFSSVYRQTPESSMENTKPVSEHPLPLKNDYAPKEETTSETTSTSPSKENPVQMFPEVKCRKRHRRKRVEDQEPCAMRGVYFKNRKWQAAIKVDKKQIHLGTVGSEEEAARLYDRAAFMCGREPNFELSWEEKQELRKYRWEEFLAMTRSAITNKSKPISQAALASSLKILFLAYFHFNFSVFNSSESQRRTHTDSDQKHPASSPSTSMAP